MRLLELGGGKHPHPLALASLDIANTKPVDIGADIWPIDDGSVDAIYASHVLEHVPKGAPTLHVMAEAHRVLRPGGTFTIKTPVVGWTDHNGVDHLTADWRVYADPTHQQPWWMPQGLLYFCEGTDDFTEYDVPRFQPLGAWFEPQDAYETVDAVGTADHSWESWWSVGDWEGLACLVR